MQLANTDIKQFTNEACLTAAKALAGQVCKDGPVAVILCQLSTWAWAGVVELLTAPPYNDVPALLDRHIAAIQRQEPSRKVEEVKDGGIWTSPLYNCLPVIRAVVWKSEMPGDNGEASYQQLCVAVFEENTSPKAWFYLSLILTRSPDKKVLWEKYL